MQSNEIILALENLKINKHYQYLIEQLKSIKATIDTDIYKEDIDNEYRLRLVSRSNTIKNFIELPDDIIAVEKLKITSEANES